MTEYGGAHWYRGREREAKIDRCVAMYRIGATLDDIAREVNRNRRTVARWLNTVAGLERRGHGHNRNAPTGHGTQAGYRRPCRCEPCRKAHARYHREYRARVATVRDTATIRHRAGVRVSA